MKRKEQSKRVSKVRGTRKRRSGTVTDHMRGDKMYETMVKTSVDGFLIADTQGRVLNVNDAYCQLIGYSRDELLNMRIHDIEALETVEQTTQHIQKTIERGFDRFETRHRRKDGKIIDIEVSVNYLDYDGGRLFVFLRGITERKKAIDEIEMLFRLPAENPNPVFRLSKEGTILYSNPAGLPILADWKREIGQDAPDQWCQLVYETLDSRMKTEFEEKIGDRTFSFVLAPVVDAGYVTVYGRDITKRSLAEEALRKAHDELEMRVQERTKDLRQATEELQAEIIEHQKAEDALLESQKDLNRAQAVAKTGSWRLDTSRNELLWSDETYRMFGIPKGTPMTYEAFLSTVHPDDRAYVDQKWQAALRGEHYDIEHRIVVTGEVKWVRERAELEFNKDGQTMGGFGTVQEITELKAMQAKLEEYSKHLEQLVEEKTEKLKEAERLAAIGETAGMVGHDIRNPLQSIEGAVYLAKEELKSSSETQEKKELQEIIEIIENQTHYMDHIVADLQDFARTPMIQPRETDIQELTNEALSVIEIPEDIKISTTIQENLPKLIVDPTCIRRVIVNLIENAVQAMPNGGKLTVKAFSEPEAVYVTVEDTGSGIAEEDKPKMFTPLYTTKAKGQGFGLAVCKKLVEAHSGEITFESEAGKGTTFKIKLPLSKKAN